MLKNQCILYEINALPDLQALTYVCMYTHMHTKKDTDTHRHISEIQNACAFLPKDVTF